ncbi:ribokinase [Sporolactobacillus kofuensis]|uniref:Deoxyribokinase n=1 Tax=Sporolactobacillus kofuensis TaxID=269672 RepID=A0ABW1WE31_9BACL|nr:ribokinase [Sporolactobacillus kofuensis]
MTIAVIGSNMVDLITYIDRMPKEGETLEAPNFEMGCGGKGANQAVAAAKLGSQVMMLTKVGDDIFGDGTISNLKSYGIDTSFVEKVPGTSSGVAPIFVDSSSKNSILIVKGANQKLSSNDIEQASDQLKKCSLIVLQLEIPLETVYDAIQFGNVHNIPVILNPAPAVKNLNFELIRHVDYFMPNESELEILTGFPVQTAEQASKAAKLLIDQGMKNVIVTLGHSGSLWVTESHTKHIPAYSVQAVDTTGAGDSFIGCFAHYLNEQKDVVDALKMATAFAALSVTRKGTQASYPSADELKEFIKAESTIIK